VALAGGDYLVISIMFQKYWLLSSGLSQLSLIMYLLPIAFLCVCVCGHDKEHIAELILLLLFFCSSYLTSM
jgi:hypothetical protein